MSSDPPLSYLGSHGPCQVCGARGVPCARCRVDFYCGKEHQRQDWARHKAGCGTVQRRGAHIVAIKDVPEGTILIKEDPVLTFPDSTSDDVLCVSCCKLLGFGAKQCSLCGLPVCNAECSRAPQHQPECLLFKRSGFKLKQRDLNKTAPCINLAVAAMRVAMLRRNEPRLKHLKSVVTPEELKAVKASPPANEYWSDNLKLHGGAVRFVRSLCRITSVSEDELSQALTVLQLNQPFKMSVDGGALPAEAKPTPQDCNLCSREEEKSRILKSRPAEQAYTGVLYAGITQLEHDCRANTTSLPWSGNGASDHIVVASRDIAAGEHISFSKSKLFDGTEARQDQLLSTLGLTCRCQRCMDPTELGLYVGSPCCPDCAGSGKRRFLLTNDFKTWYCKGCGKQKSRAAMKGILSASEAKFQELQNRGADEETWHNFIEEQVFPNGPLHPTHSIILHAKHELRLGVWMKRAEFFSPSAKLTCWDKVLNDLLAAFDVLHPGRLDERCRVIIQRRRILLQRVEAAQRSGNFLLAVKFNSEIMKVNKQMCKHIYDEEVCKLYRH